MEYNSRKMLLTATKCFLFESPNIMVLYIHNRLINYLKCFRQILDPLLLNHY